VTNFLCRFFSPSFPSRVVTALLFPQIVRPHGGLVRDRYEALFSPA
jgi:hypothetical protein